MADYSNMSYEDMDAEIRACEALLKNTDHAVVEMLEGLCECTSATAISNYLKSLTEGDKAIISARRTYRQTIVDLQARMAEIEEEGV